MRWFLIIIISVLIFGCGGSSNQETKIETVEPEKYQYSLTIRKEFQTETWENYDIKFENDSTYLVLKIKWTDEYGAERSKSFYDSSRSFTVYHPYSNLRYEVMVESSKEIYEEGILQ